MLKIAVRQIDNEGIEFKGSATPEMIDLDKLEDIDEDIEFKNIIEYQLHVSLVSGGILVAGTLNTIVQCICGRCLKKFGLHFTKIEVCHFYENFHGTELNIAPELREDLLINLPMKFICSQECKGIEYKAEKNTGVKKRNESFDQENNPWKELDDLKL